MNSRENQIIKDFIMSNEYLSGTPFIDRLRQYRSTINPRTRPYSEMPRQSARPRPQAQDVRHLRDTGIMGTVDNHWEEYNPFMADSQQEIGNPSSDYKISVDIDNFAPEDMVVKVVGRIVIVKGQHDQRQEGQCSSMRMFVKKYKVPDNVDLDFMKCNLTRDKYLVITAPVRELPGNSYRLVPIQKTDATPSREFEQPRQAGTFSEQRSQQVFVDLDNTARPTTATRGTAPPPAHMQPNTLQPRGLGQPYADFQLRPATQRSADAKPRAAPRSNVVYEPRAATQLNVDIQSAIRSELLATAQQNAYIEPPAKAQPNADSGVRAATQPNTDAQNLTDTTNADVSTAGNNAAPEQI